MDIVHSRLCGRGRLDRGCRRRRRPCCGCLWLAGDRVRYGGSRARGCGPIPDHRRRAVGVVRSGGGRAAMRRWRRVRRRRRFRWAVDGEVPNRWAPTDTRCGVRPVPFLYFDRPAAGFQRRPGTADGLDVAADAGADPGPRGRRVPAGGVIRTRRPNCRDSDQRGRCDRCAQRRERCGLRPRANRLDPCLL